GQAERRARRNLRRTPSPVQSRLLPGEPELGRKIPENPDRHAAARLQNLRPQRLLRTSQVSGNAVQRRFWQQSMSSMVILRQLIEFPTSCPYLVRSYHACPSQSHCSTCSEQCSAVSALAGLHYIPPALRSANQSRTMPGPLPTAFHRIS